MNIHKELMLVEREKEMVASMGYQFGWVTILGEEEEDIINKFFHLHMELTLVEDFLPIHLEFIKKEVPLSISITTPPMMTIDSLPQPMSSVVYISLVTMHATSSRFEFGVYIKQKYSTVEYSR
jgi:hypothetical protein